ncbi:RNA binding motif protein 25 S homeolog [Xenopus laevis]|uniref:RNA-binding protein 25 n=2 Tax=Xenopus laevis TaxID=8355 RepID=Q08B25_XENLA|nr:RNA binding motif protein 25 S homeolog [Xenopus laevis]AAI24905.1 RNPC7 protein [Xenopus laevis]OCT64838.1 hypothetical protein XELAEV_18041077mg [Xenopus laevis]
MSYPPHLNRPPMGIPTLPPGIPPPQFPGFPPPPGTPMIPVPMSLMAPGPTVLVPTVSMIGKHMGPRKDMIGLKNKENDENSGPTTTVFVGNISEKASDMLIRQLLAKCGLVLSWKRVQGASGKLQAFGFCEYKEPESTLRALRLLHDLQIGEKKLLVKVDAKTKAQLDEWKATKRASNGSAKPESAAEDEDDVDEETKRRDGLMRGSIEVLIKEYSSELNAPSLDSDSHARKKKKDKKEEMSSSVQLQEDINAIEMEEDKRDLISREISKFRDTHKKLEEEKGKKEKERQEIEKDRKDRERERERERREREREREKEREKEKERERDRERNSERNKDRDRDRDRERDRDRDKDRDRVQDHIKDRSRSREKSRDRDRDRERDRERERERERERDRDRDKDKKRDREEDEEEAYERRKLERKLREKEAAYQERLKNWEIRERKKTREYEKDAEREEERRRDTTKEGKRLKEFLEDYDDDRDDPKYYRGSALQKRLRDREKELEADDRDRKREKEELEEIRQRLLAEGHPDPDAELQRIEQEEERRRQPPQIKPPPESEEEEEVKPMREEKIEEPVEEEEPEPKPCLKPTMRPISSAPSVSSGSANATPNSPGDESPCGIIIPHENSPEQQPPEEYRPKIELSLKLGAPNSPSQPNTTKRKKLPVDSVFNKFDDEDSDEVPRKRKLVPLDYEDDDKTSAKNNVNTEEKRKHIKSLIEKIPTAKPELFAYPLDWSIVDTTLMERRIRPWINKKIIEYIGEEEATLVDFVCSKVMAHGTPQSILDDVAMVLDEEAEVFIVKMWRLLIYETEAKKIGLVK